MSVDNKIRVNDAKDQEYLDLEYDMRDVVAPPQLHSEAVNIVNALLVAGRSYQDTLESIGYLDDARPGAKLTAASKQLQELYSHIVRFVDALNEDTEIVQINGKETYLGWNDLIHNLDTLDELIRPEFKSRSVARLFAFGLFSMIPLIAAATRFHYKLELQQLSDRKRALVQLVSLCRAYDQFQFKLRDMKAQHEKVATVPIYQPAFAFRKHFVGLANYAKARLRTIVKEEETLSLRKRQEEVARIAAENERRRAIFRATGFEQKKDRLIILWNARQRKESNPYKRRMLGSAGISEYLKTVKASGLVRPQSAFDTAKDSWSETEISCLANCLRKYHMLGPRAMWERIITETCGYQGILGSRPLDQLLNYAKLMKLSELDHGSGEGFWRNVPDLDLCELLPTRLIVVENAIVID